MIIDFAAARKRLLAMAHVKPVKPDLNTLINRLAEQKASDLRAIKAKSK